MNTLKLWIAGLITGVVMLLVGWLKIVTSQRDSARKDRDIAEKNAKVIEKVSRAQQDLAIIKEKSRKETEDAKAVEITERPTGGFGSKRLRK